MLDFGWPELFLIIALAVIFIGPNEIPGVMVALGRIVRRLTYVKYAISQQFDEIMREADLDDIRKSVNFEAKDDQGNPIDFDEAASDEEYALSGAYDYQEEPEELGDEQEGQGKDV